MFSVFPSKFPKSPKKISSVNYITNTELSIHQLMQTKIFYWGGGGL